MSTKKPPVITPGEFEVAPELLAKAKAHGHDFSRNVFEWESHDSPMRHHVLLIDDELAAVAHESSQGGWIASDYGGQPVNLRPVTEKLATKIAVRSALLLFTPGAAPN